MPGGLRAKIKILSYTEVSHLLYCNAWKAKGEMAMDTNTGSTPGYLSQSQ